MEQTVKNIIAKICGPGALLPNVDLIESGILDSLAFIELLSEFEDIGIEIQPTQVDKNEFRTCNSIINLAKQYKSQHDCSIL
jgi:D-alanine--poly(phosphoribitol) ligase subunit 2